MSQSIDLKSVSATLTGRAILSDITLTLSERRIGIIGRNGSGKTTLLRLIAGLIPATTGEVSIQGHTPQDRRAMLSHLGILFQNPDHQILFPTVREELAFGLRQIGQSKAQSETEVQALLTSEGRSHWLNANTHSLSHGQKHYLCLLAVLLMKPQTILLDEPFAGLDMPTQIRLARRLDALPQQLITITHDPAAVMSCDRILWLDQGRIHADGSAAQILPAFTAAMTQLGAQDADTDL